MSCDNPPEISYSGCEDMGYYIANKGVQEGPFEAIDLPQHGLRADSLVWAEGMPDWKRADAVPEIAALLAPAPMDETIPPVAEPTAAPSPFQPQPTYSPQPQPQPGMMSYQTPTFQQNNGLAVASMVLGIVSFPVSILYCAGVITALLAIIFGFLARGKIKRGETAVGAGMALAGIILGFVYFGLLVVLICFFAIGIGMATIHSKP